MINTLRLYEELTATFGEGPARTLTRVIGSIYDDLQNTVTKEDFRERKQVVAELAQAQKRTEEAVYHLSRRVDDTNRQLGGLAMTVGYALENTAYVYLPDLLRTDYGLSCEGPLSRDYLTDLKGRDVEVNILGRGKLEGREILIVGESKAQLGKNDVKDFLKRLSRLDTGGSPPSRSW